MKKILMIAALMLPMSAMAQNIIMDTNSQLLTHSMMSQANEPSRPKPKPTVSAQLYQERVPGKPQEGFVPVPRNVPAVKYTQDTVRANGDTIKMMDDKEKGIKCYWLRPYQEPQNLSCVKY